MRPRVDRMREDTITMTKLEALAKHLGIDTDDITEESDELFSVGRQEYLVLTEDEAEQAWNEHLDQYIEDCIMPGLPKPYRVYFDTALWKRDARYDGRGHCLSSYDGSEYEEGEYFIYRVG